MHAWGKLQTRQPPQAVSSLIHSSSSTFSSVDKWRTLVFDTHCLLLQEAVCTYLLDDLISYVDCNKVNKNFWLFYMFEATHFRPQRGRREENEGVSWRDAPAANNKHLWWSCRCFLYGSPRSRTSSAGRLARWSIGLPVCVCFLFTESEIQITVFIVWNYDTYHIFHS